VSVRILYFARLREDMGIAEEMFDLPAQASDVKSLRAQLIARGGAWATALGSGKAVRVSVNLDLARDDTPVKAGDEVAFFPPVTGG
jgi:sulfur-carrier protein